MELSAQSLALPRCSDDSSGIYVTTCWAVGATPRREIQAYMASALQVHPSKNGDLHQGRVGGGSVVVLSPRG